MASRPHNEGMQLRSDFETVCEILDVLADVPADEIEYANGWIMSESDTALMKISYDGVAREEFWKPHPQDAKLDEAMESHEALVEDIEHGLTPRHTLIDAYDVSTQYYGFLWFCLYHAAFYNPVFGETKRFETIGGNQWWDDLHVETKFMFGSPGYPHVTIISIQPQQTPDLKLMYTEFWTLYYWAAKLCKRVVWNPNKTLPIRLVSLCDSRARVVSAVFSPGFIRCIGFKSADPKGEDVSCKIHIGEYYDFRDPASTLLFAKEMIAEPTGNKTISKEDARAMHREHMLKG